MRPSRPRLHSECALLELFHSSIKVGLCRWMRWHRIIPVSHPKRQGNESWAPFSTHICGFQSCPPPRLQIWTVVCMPSILSFVFRQLSGVVAHCLLHVIRLFGQSGHLVLEFRRFLAETSNLFAESQHAVVRFKTAAHGASPLVFDNCAGHVLLRTVQLQRVWIVWDPALGCVGAQSRRHRPGSSSLCQRRWFFFAVNSNTEATGERKEGIVIQVTRLQQGFAKC